MPQINLIDFSSDIARGTNYHHHHIIIRFHEKNKMTDFNCTICFDDFNGGVKHDKDKGGCGRVVCNGCWLKLGGMPGRRKCPSCRGDFQNIATHIYKEKPKPYKPPKPKCRRCGGNHKDENSLKCPNKYMSWKQYWRPANINGGNKPKPTFCQQCMQEGKVYHHIDELVESNRTLKMKQSHWADFLKNSSPATFVCKKHKEEVRGALFDVSSSEDEVIDSGSGTDTEDEASAPATTGGGSKDEGKPVPTYIKNMLKELVAEYGIKSIMKEIVN